MAEFGGYLRSFSIMIVLSIALLTGLVNVVGNVAWANNIDLSNSSLNNNSQFVTSVLHVQDKMNTTATTLRDKITAIKAASGNIISLDFGLAIINGVAAAASSCFDLITNGQLMLELPGMLVSGLGVDWIINIFGLVLVLFIGFLIFQIFSKVNP